MEDMTHQEGPGKKQGSPPSSRSPDVLEKLIFSGFFELPFDSLLFGGFLDILMGCRIEQFRGPLGGASHPRPLWAAWLRPADEVGGIFPWS